MTEANSAAATSEPPITAWTCGRCEMTVTFTDEVKSPRLPTTWASENGILYCLSCRREMAGEAGVEELDEGAPSEDRQRARSQGRIEFEIRRDPERPDNRIAKACHTSTVAVRKARARLGIAPQLRP
jgi:hypothetical protein